ncbi:hypothetical protein U1Q18_039941 [Sarracenia purpurea var. burkii]
MDSDELGLGIGIRFDPPGSGLCRDLAGRGLFLQVGVSNVLDLVAGTTRLEPIDLVVETVSLVCFGRVPMVIGFGSLSMLSTSCRAIAASSLVSGINRDFVI